MACMQEPEHTEAEMKAFEYIDGEETKDNEMLNIMLIIKIILLFISL